MKTITVRVDDNIAGELEQLAAEERESTSTLVRRYVRRGLKADGRDPDSARAHEGTGRVQ